MCVVRGTCTGDAGAGGTGACIGSGGIVEGQSIQQELPSHTVVHASASACITVTKEANANAAQAKYLLMENPPSR